jgi:hypothetical protein
MSSENDFMILYNASRNLPPYQPTATWCANAVYKNDESLLRKESIKFVPDNFLKTKREFIRDKL